MDPTRIKVIGDKFNPQGKSIVYVVSRDLRLKDNHALLYAYNSALTNKLPLVVIFNLYPTVKNRSLNSYKWMIESLLELKANLSDLNIPLYLVKNKSANELAELLNKELNPVEVFFDFSPLKGPKNFKDKFASISNSRTIVVDTHNIIPIWEASIKEEFAAYTLRPKLKKLLDTYLKPTSKLNPININGLDISKEFVQEWDFNSLIKDINAVELSNYSLLVAPGESAANNTVKDFIENKLMNYFKDRNNPTVDAQSNLSAYLHFGCISALSVTLDIIDFCSKRNVKVNFGFKTDVKDFDFLNEDIKLKVSAEAFLEELIVRKELADNYCYYNSNYDSLKGAKSWAINTLKSHLTDKREHIYSIKELEYALTYDAAWNASQIQLLRTGKIHGYMRMYWAKKVMDWTPNPDTAINYLIYLNDKYSLDGYDPNGYVGVLWSIAGLHDRAWFERPVFGQIRYMNANGLARKFDLEEYINKWVDM